MILLKFYCIITLFYEHILSNHALPWLKIVLSIKHDHRKEIAVLGVSIANAISNKGHFLLFYRQFCLAVSIILFDTSKIKSKMYFLMSSKFKYVWDSSRPQLSKTVV